MTAEQAINELRVFFVELQFNAHGLKRAARGLECVAALEHEINELNRRAATERSERCPNDER